MATSNGSQSQNGGFWSSPQANYSKQTQDLLKDMMRESKLTNFQQRKLHKSMTDGGTLPVECPPTHSLRPRPKPQPIPKNKPLNPRNCRENEKRKKDSIEASGAYERAKFKPIPGVTRTEKDKIRLANIMAYGEDTDPTKARVRQPIPVDDSPYIDRFDELQLEIEERKQFLEKMESLGEGKKYRPIIDTEVSQVIKAGEKIIEVQKDTYSLEGNVQILIRELEVIDSKRTAELERRLAQQDGR